MYIYNRILHANKEEETTANKMRLTDIILKQKKPGKKEYGAVGGEGKVQEQV